MNKDASINLTISYNPTNTTQSKTYTISSSDTSIISVSGTIITAKKVGKATITATCNGKTTSKEITVVSPLQSIAFTNAPSTMNKDASVNLTISYNPSDTTDSKTYTISSSDTSIISVSGTAITAKKVGKATVTATCNGKTTSKEITVVSLLQSIAFTNAPISMTEGDSATLTISYNPSDTTDSKTYTINSSDTSIISVSGTTITAKKVGKATVTATCNGKTTSKEITVVQKEVPLQSIAFTNAPTSMTEGDSAILTISYNPTNTTQSKTYTISSSDTSIISVSGTTITAKKAGKATVTATCNGKTTSKEITVVQGEIPLQSIDIKNNISEIVIGKLVQIQLIYNPDNTTESRNFTIKSSDTSVISVEGEKIKGVKEGKATITVTTTSGKTISKEVMVVKEPDFLKGDLDRNHVIDANDASIALEIFKAENATAEDILIGDMDDNNLIDANDASLILELYKTNM